MTLKKCDLTGLSTDTKPVNGIASGSTYTENDTGRVYTFNLNKGMWILNSTSAVANTSATCVGIYSIDLLKSEGTVDIYKISYTNGASTTFNVTNGSDIIFNKNMKPTLVENKLYTLDVIEDKKDKYFTYKSLHLDDATVEEDGTIISKEIPNNKFWPRTEEGKFFLSNKDKNLELVFTYAGKNGSTYETWQAFGLNQQDEFVRYVGKFYWTDIEDQSEETGTYYFKAKQQKISFKSLQQSINKLITANDTLNARVEKLEAHDGAYITDINQLKDGLAAANDAINTVTESVTTTLDEAKNYTDESVEAEHAEMIRETSQNATAIEQNTTSIKLIAEEIKDAIGAGEKIAKLQADMTKANADIQANAENITNNAADITSVASDLSATKTTYTTKFEQVDAKIAEVAEDATNAINANTSLINTVNSALTQSITDEKTARENADETLYNNVTDEYTAAVAQAYTDAVNAAKDYAPSKQNLLDEINFRQQEDSELDDKIEANTTAITDEVTRATAAESSLDNKIAEEKARAEVVEAELDAAIANSIELATSTITDTWDGEITATLKKDTYSFDGSVNLPTDKIVSKLEQSTTDWHINYYTLDSNVPKSIMIPGSSSFNERIDNNATNITNLETNLSTANNNITAVTTKANENATEILNIKNNLENNYLDKDEIDDVYQTKAAAELDHDNIVKTITEMANCLGSYRSVEDLHLDYNNNKLVMDIAIIDALNDKVSSPDDNDYVYVSVQDNTDDNNVKRIARFGWTKELGQSDPSWHWIFDANAVPFTTTQLNAIDSGITPDLVQKYNDYEDNKVDKVAGSSLMTDVEHNKLAAISAEATKVEKSSTNGNIKINGTETKVYDDTTLANKVANLETAVVALSELVNELLVGHDISTTKLSITPGTDVTTITLKTRANKSATIKN